MFKSQRSFFSCLKLEWKFLLFSAFLTFFAAAFFKLKQDGLENYQSNKNALVLEVFSEADLDLNTAKELEIKLKSLEGVKEVISTAPLEALNKLTLEPGINVDLSWLKEKNFLPWSYDLHLTRWDNQFLQDLISRVESLRLGEDGRRVVAEVHYDKERWSLVYALQNYLRWIEQAFFVGGFFMFGFLLVAFFKFFYIGGTNLKAGLNLMKEFLFVLVSGFLAGLMSALLYTGVLSYSFFPESFFWKEAVKKYFLFQIVFATMIYFIIFEFSKRHD